MALKTFKPYTKSTRGTVVVDKSALWKGSPHKPLTRGQHVTGGRNCYSKQIINRGNYYIELLENYQCNNVYELEVKESEYQKSIKCVNHNIARRTKREYYDDKKEEIDKKKSAYRQKHLEYYKNYDKQYCIKNAEWIKEKNHKIINCECGRAVKYHSLSTHKRSKRHIDLMNKLNLS